ncbi:MAG: imidazole glycerol phosphate synthase subunit HisF, partial [Chloroflexi bacterium]|nr:imidazole glycerol phosphate synthase subunit HisF [Chloroflexota bacterium]
MEENGAGEIIVQSVDKDGTYEGYDIELIKKVAEAVTIPVVALGGAKEYNDFSQATKEGLASAVAAGSLFVYYGPRHAVLISFPNKNELKEIFS